MEVLITSEEEKLPEAVRVLLDETRPLLPGIAFFEQRFTFSTVVARLMGGLALLVVGALAIALGVRMLVDDSRHATVYTNNSTDWWVIGFGAVSGLAGWVMISTLREAWAISRRQGTGGHTRHGIYLLPHALVSRSSFDTTVIPRTCFRGLEGNSVRYEHAGQVKSFSLPDDLINTTPAGLQAAVLAWSQLPDPE